jgi:hypothetical protein
MILSSDALIAEARRLTADKTSTVTLSPLQAQTIIASIEAILTLHPEAPEYAGLRSFLIALNES